MCSISHFVTSEPWRFLCYGSFVHCFLHNSDAPNWGKHHVLFCFSPIFSVNQRCLRFSTPLSSHSLTWQHFFALCYANRAEASLSNSSEIIRTELNAVIFDVEMKGTYGDVLMLAGWWLAVTQQHLRNDQIFLALVSALSKSACKHRLPKRRASWFWPAAVQHWAHAGLAEVFIWKKDFVNT